MKIIQMNMSKDENNCHFEKTWIEIFKKAPSNSAVRMELEKAVDFYSGLPNKRTCAFIYFPEKISPVLAY